MKKIHIAILIVIAGAIAIILSNFGGFTTVETFASAANQQGKSIKIPAFLDTTEAVIYDELVNANEFSFYAIDKNGNKRKVICKKSKPTDFERAEQLNMSGRMEGDIFICENMQMKCPSKYEGQEFVEVGS